MCSSDLSVVRALTTEDAVKTDPDYPFVLAAGERRAFTANTIMRDPSWRRRDPTGALRMCEADASALSVATGDMVRVITRTGSTQVPVDVVDGMRSGHVALPNGLGLTSVDQEKVGVQLNQLTSTSDRDEFVGTPWHKHVPARLEKVSTA